MNSGVVSVNFVVVAEVYVDLQFKIRSEKWAVRNSVVVAGV